MWATVFMSLRSGFVLMALMQWCHMIAVFLKRTHTVDGINPALPLRTLKYGNYGIFLIMVCTLLWYIPYYG